ncbi:MAG: pentapeptide repeat-containing protein [Planctomycetaceae bacterium]|nr:pentapeptide repeat-containing protein [Planctomycetaceae bacterium]
MITASPARVTPRVIAAGRQESLPLEMLAEEFCAKHDVGCLLIHGGEGQGKTTALAHLAATLPNADEIVFLDEPPLDEVRATAERARAIVAWKHDKSGLKAWHCRLSPWSRDDLIEYLLAAHPAECRSVMSRLQLPNMDKLHASPAFWTILLDSMAADEKLHGFQRVVRHCCHERVPDPHLRDKVRWHCLSEALSLNDQRELEQELSTLLPRDSRLFMSSGYVKRIFAVEQAIEGLQTEHCAELLMSRWPIKLIEAVAVHVQADSETAQAIRDALNGPNSRLYAMAASLLLRIDPNWRPVPSMHQKGLAGAFLQNVRWEGCDLAGFVFTETVLNSADLRRADLSDASFTHGRLVETQLTGAILKCARFIEAELYGADLNNADCQRTYFQKSSLQNVVACSGNFDVAELIDTNCSHGDFRQANFRSATFTDVELSDSDFSDADLTGVALLEGDLRTTEFSGAKLELAQLHRINIEDVEWSSVDFSQAVLTGAKCTGSILHRTSFRGAILLGAELGEIHWEEADLRDADLRDATFHLGSSRSGLVGSPIASEGSRTGFYTDESTEQYFQAPEDIRKANLRGADLRGARIDGVDFYLVDLRGAQLDPHQLQQLRGTGAILDPD